MIEKRYRREIEFVSKETIKLCKMLADKLFSTGAGRPAHSSPVVGEYRERLESGVRAMLDIVSSSMEHVVESEFTGLEKGGTRARGIQEVKSAKEWEKRMKYIEAGVNDVVEEAFLAYVNFAGRGRDEAFDKCKGKLRREVERMQKDCVRIVNFRQAPDRHLA